MSKATPKSHDSVQLSNLSRSGKPSSSSRLRPDRLHNSDDDSSDLVHISQETSRQPSPFAELPHPDHFTAEENDEEDDSDLDNWGDDTQKDMPSDLRGPDIHRPRSTGSNSGGANAPLLSRGDKPEDYDNGSGSSRRPGMNRRQSSRFRERDPEAMAKAATRTRYTYAAIFLAISLVSFAVQTETAVYIQHNLGWKKPFCML